MPLLPLRYNGSNQITATSFHRHISSFAESATGKYLLCRIFSAGEEEEQKSQKGLRILACSLILQATRMGMISTLLKEKRTWLYGTMITIGGVINIAVCIGGASLLKAPYIPMLTLSGDLCLSLFLLAYFVKNRRFRW